MFGSHGAFYRNQRVAGELWQVVFLGAWTASLPEIACHRA